MVTTFLNFTYHHGRKFLRNGGFLCYIDGKVTKMPLVDVDLVSYLDILANFKRLGYRDAKNVFWMHPLSDNLDIGIRLLADDKDINVMCDAAMSEGKNHMHLYFEHPMLGDENTVLVLGVIHKDNEHKETVVEETRDEEVVVEETQVEEAVVEDVEVQLSDSSSEDSIYKPSLYSDGSDSDIDQGDKKK